MCRYRSYTKTEADLKHERLEQRIAKEIAKGAPRELFYHRGVTGREVLSRGIPAGYGYLYED